MQSVAPSIKHIADTTEHAHIKVVKDPASATNNHNYESQICQYLDHLENQREMLLAYCNTQEDIVDSPAAVLDEIWTAQWGRTNFFNPNPTLPFLTFIAGLTVIHLNSSPSLHHIPIYCVAQIFNHPDLCGALGDYLNHEDVHLPFKDLHQKSYHDPSSVLTTFSVHTHPPNNKWKYGHYDAAILNVDQEAEWPLSGLQGHAVIHVHLIMHSISPRGTVNPFTNCFLMYAQWFNIVPQANGSVVEHTTGLHLLKRATCTSGSVLGEVFPLDQVRSYAHIVPHFDHIADNWFTTSNSIHFLQSFFLNKYFNKDFFYTIS
ncbi:hypothetical protein V8B97DRAFT_2026503 [Scleroderma yunnanense]